MSLFDFNKKNDMKTPDLKKANILIVDDQQDNIDVLHDFLEIPRINFITLALKPGKRAVLVQWSNIIRDTKQKDRKQLV